MIGLNHSFLTGIAQDPLGRALEPLRQIEHIRRRTRALPCVHETLAMFETGDGRLLQWANGKRNDTELWPLCDLLLRMTSGPFATGHAYEGPIDPAIDALDEWLQELVRVVLGAPEEALAGLVSPEPAGGADPASFRGATREVSNWLDRESFDRDLTARSDGRTTLDVLLAAEQEMDGQLVVLPSARRSAEAWTLDCRASELHRALLGLEEYVTALREGLSRESAANRYYERTSMPMSQESAATRRKPTRRRQRCFVAGHHGEQYFDMHAKPGNLTRVHIWTPPIAAAATTSIYVGHCGRHLT